VDTVDLPLEDIDRIEVIRGPGGTIWGANAVNGVISIFTKRAADTTGALVTAQGGDILQGATTLQYGGKWGADGAYRVYGKYTDQGELRDLDGNRGGGDPWHQLRGGFRADREIPAEDSLTLQGDFYIGRESEQAFFLPDPVAPGLIPIEQRIDLSGGSLQSVWDHTFASGSQINTNFPSTPITAATRSSPRPDTHSISTSSTISRSALGMTSCGAWAITVRQMTSAAVSPYLSTL